MNEIKQSKKELRILNDRLKEAKHELDQVLVSRNSAMINVQELEREVTRLENQKSILEGYIDDHKQRKADLEHELDQQNETVVNTNQTIANLTEEKTVLEKETKDLDENMKRERKERLDELKARIDEKQAKIDKLNDRIAGLKGDLEEMQNETHAVADKHKTLVEQSEGLEERIDALKQKRDKLSAKVDEIRAEITAEETRHADLIAQREELQNATTEAQSGLEAVNDEIEAKKAEKADIEKEIESTRHVYEDEKMKLFNIAEREKAVRQRELFIKKKYEEAGIPFR